MAGDKLSPIIVAALRGFIAEKEAEAKGFERSELSFDDADDHHFPKRKAFYGKWVLSRAAPYEHEPEFSSEGDGTTDHCAVAVTAKGSAVFFSWTESPGGDPYCFRLAIFPSPESAAEHRIYNGPRDRRGRPSACRSRNWIFSPAINRYTT